MVQYEAAAKTFSDLSSCRFSNICSAIAPGLDPGGKGPGCQDTSLCRAARGAQTLNSLGFAKPPSQTRVVAAMSGGVDSSVVAAMLAREGYDVVGVTLQLYDHGAAVNKPGACCAGQDIHDARRVADSHGLSALRARLRKPLPQRGDGRFR